jgi:peptide/nickel transport system substrate-binding protein
LRGNASAVNGWCDSPAIETLREAWLSTPTADGRKALARRLQRQAFHDVPYIPLGQIAQLTALRSDLAGMVRGFPVFWNIRRV